MTQTVVGGCRSPRSSQKHPASLPKKRGEKYCKMWHIVATENRKAGRSKKKIGKASLRTHAELNPYPLPEVAGFNEREDEGSQSGEAGRQHDDAEVGQQDAISQDQPLQASVAGHHHCLVVRKARGTA